MSPSGRVSTRARTLSDILAPEANSFGVVRLAMAAAVLISHSFWFASGSGANEPMYAITGFSLGEHAVQVFFFLSGVLVAQSFDKSRSVLDFAVARALRIFPGLIVCVFATALGIGLAVTTMGGEAYLADPGLKAYIIKTIALVSGSVPLPGVFEALPLPGLFNVSLWTLKYEVLCYGGVAVLGVLGLFRARYRIVATVLLGLFIGACAAVLPVGPHAFTMPQNIAYFFLTFTTGVAAYLVRDWLPVHWGPFVVLFLAAAAAISTPWQILATALFLGYATIGFASCRFGGLTSWTRRNDLSFGLYIYAAPIQQALIQCWPGIDPYALSVAALMLTLPCAALSWSLVERPALSMRSKAVSVLRSGLRMNPKHPGAPKPRIAAALRHPRGLTGTQLNQRMGRASKSYRRARGSLTAA